MEKEIFTNVELAYINYKISEWEAFKKDAYYNMSEKAAKSFGEVIDNKLPVIINRMKYNILLNRNDKNNHQSGIKYQIKTMLYLIPGVVNLLGYLTK